MDLNQNINLEETEKAEIDYDEEVQGGTDFGKSDN